MKTSYKNKYVELRRNPPTLCGGKFDVSALSEISPKADKVQSKILELRTKEIYHRGKALSWRGLRILGLY